MKNVINFIRFCSSRVRQLSRTGRPRCFKSALLYFGQVLQQILTLNIDQFNGLNISKPYGQIHRFIGDWPFTLYRFLMQCQKRMIADWMLAWLGYSFSLAGALSCSWAVNFSYLRSFQSCISKWWTALFLPQLDMHSSARYSITRFW
jgi:hypothetical protein